MQFHWLLGMSVVLLPTAISTVCGAVCPMRRDAGGAVRARPPSWAFGVVWPLLFLGLGFVLLTCENKWPALALTILLPLWQLVYAKGCGDAPRTAAWLLVACAAVALIGLAYAATYREHVGIVVLGALAAWLLFAQQLAVLDLQLS